MSDDAQLRNAALRNLAAIQSLRQQAEDELQEQRRAVERLNAQLEQRVAERVRELEALNADLRSFSYSVSHDLKAPLSAIDGFTAELQRSLGDRLDPRERHYMERVRRNVEHMGQLIEALLALAQASHGPLAMQRVDIAALARTIAQELAEAQPRQRAVVHIEPGLVAMADPALVAVVLRNLLGNAWKFCSQAESTEITVTGKPHDSGALVQFCVRDNGVGFDRELAGQLFQPFRRLHTGTQFPGTGIGLAMASSIVRRHGGGIWAEGEPGAGASVYFTLPAVAP